MATDVRGSPHKRDANPAARVEEGIAVVVILKPETSPRPVPKVTPTSVGEGHPLAGLTVQDMHAEVKSHLCGASGPS